MLSPHEIPDPNVREWYISKHQEQQNRWLIPVWSYNAHIKQGVRYLSWIQKTICHNDSDSVVLLTDDTESQVVQVFNRQVTCCRFSSKQFDPELFSDIINRFHINCFFCHGMFSQSILEMRKYLLSSHYIHQIMCQWHEGGFFRRRNPQQSKCQQLDWMGWNALSSLASLELTKINRQQVNRSIVDSFMQEFKEQKVLESDTSCLLKIRTTKPLILVILQVEKDSVIHRFCPPEFRQMKNLYQFIDVNPDYYFIVKEHPLQIDGASHFEEGFNKNRKNCVYISKDEEVSSLDLALHCDAVLVLNSTVGFECLFWKPVIAIGHSVYTHPELISRPGDDLKLQIKRPSDEDLYAFFYYAIMKFHFSQGYNAKCYDEWLYLAKSIKQDFLDNNMGKIIDIKDFYE